METRSRTIRSTMVFRWLFLGLALAIGVLAWGDTPAAGEEPQIQIQVHQQNYDWVQGQVTSNASVAITLEDSDGQSKGSYTDSADDNGWFGS